jgi:multidrug efflux system outer membrane protein
MKKCLAGGGALAALLVLFSACKMGPNYQRPAVAVPANYRDLSGSQQMPPQAASYADLPWWQVFQDAQLQDLIRTALKQNYDLVLAAQRVDAARAQLGIVRANQYPQIAATANFTGGKDYNFQTKSNFLVLNLDAGFQLDLFGRLRRATEAARAQLLASEDARRTVVMTLVSDVATDYFQLLELDLELEITRDTVKSQEDAVKLTNLRLSHGVATRLDVLQAQQILDTANTQIPDLERQIAQTEDAISILLGQYAHGITRGRPLVQQLLPPEVPAGLPSSLLERRPDVREAEHNLMAANADIGVAKASFFPQIALTGSGGGAFGRSSVFSSMMSSQTAIWNYALQSVQPIYAAGAIRSNLRLAEAQYQKALTAYEQAIQRAFGEVSDALIAYQKSHEVRIRQEQTVRDLEDSVNISMMRYRGGTATYLEVLVSQRSLYAAQLILAQARASEYQSLVQLYKSMGGGWQP